MIIIWNRFLRKHLSLDFIDAAAAAAKSLQSCLTLRDPIDGSPPGSPIPGILQARTLEWVAISFSNHLHILAQREMKVCVCIQEKVLNEPRL